MRYIHRIVPGLLCWLGLSSMAFAQVSAVPTGMSFQGRLAQSSGNPLPDGNYTIQFSVFNAATGGTLLWQRSLTNIPVKNGAFGVVLDFSGGFQNGATQSSLFSGAAAFLEIKVGADPALAPRQSLLTVPYAFKANSVLDGSITNTSLAAGSITVDKFASNLLNTNVWLLTGNSGVTSGFLGTTDLKPLVFRVNNHRAVRYDYAENTTFPGNEYRSINIIGGSELNFVAAGVTGATIAGGGQDYFTASLDHPNSVSADFATVSGGSSNAANGFESTIAGGSDNTTGGANAAVSGGISNAASGDYATIGGGADNTASHAYATVAGGFFNTAGGVNAAVLGGDFNTASGNDSVVAGGNNNMAAALISFAAGKNAKANHAGAWVWADNTNADFASTAENQFLIRASGGVKLSPLTTLEFGFGVSGKEQNAGKIGYGAFTANTLDIVGGGQASGTRKVKIWAEGGTTFTGNITVNGTNYTSDARYKTHVATLPDALETILNLRGVSFDWDRAKWADRGFASGKQIGFIAQEVEKVLPELVTTDSTGYKSVAYANVVPVLVEAVKTLNSHWEETQQRQQMEIAELRAQLTALQTALKAGKRP